MGLYFVTYIPVYFTIFCKGAIKYSYGTHLITTETCYPFSYTIHLFERVYGKFNHYFVHCYSP